MLVEINVELDGMAIRISIEGELSLASESKTDAAIEAVSRATQGVKAALMMKAKEALERR